MKKTVEEHSKDGAFVFCNFNNTYKLMPRTFASWMRILKQVPGSMMWLWQGGIPVFAANIRREAEAHGVDAGRIAFAGLVPSEENLARLKLADLSLDTLPYNAHTTAAVSPPASSKPSACRNW